MGMDAEQLEAVGRQIVAAREGKGWSQVDLARRAGFTDSTIRKVETGVRVSPGTLRKVLDTVGIEPLSEQVQRIGYPRDVQALLDLMGMYLVALPEAERVKVAYEMTQFLIGRDASGGKLRTGE